MTNTVYKRAKMEVIVFVGAVAEFDSFNLVVTIIMNDARFGCTVLTSFIAVTSFFLISYQELSITL